MSPRCRTGETAKILVVDDEEVVCLSCSRVLSGAGYAVECVESPVDGLEMVREHAYDVVFVDVKMPVMDGLELLRRIKEARPETVVVIMTGYAEHETAERAEALGAYAYLLKPFTPRELEELLQKITQDRSPRAGDLGGSSTKTETSAAAAAH